MNMISQYVVNARFKIDGKMHEFPRLVTQDIDEAMTFDVSAYEPPWEVWLEHFIINENREVIDSRTATILFPA